MPGNVLVIDQGGHASRALIFDQGGRLVATGLREVGEVRPLPDRVEQDPEELVASVREAVAEALEAFGGRGEIAGAGMATQRSSIVCWNGATGKALSPVISWQDRRAAAWLAELSHHAESIHRKTGLLLSPHYGASKLRWCLDHLPRLAVARREGRLRCGPLASFLAFRLLGERPMVVDPANAGRTLLWNLQDGDWDAELLELFGVPREVLPECVPTRWDFGGLRLPGGSVPFTVLNGDQSAVVFAWGEPEEGTVYLNLGTGAFLQRAFGGAPELLHGLLASVVLRDDDRLTWVLEGTVNGAGSAVRLVGKELGIARPEERLAQWLEETVEPPLFLNGVSGLGSPFWVSHFESGFVGEGQPWEKLVAVVESVVFLVVLNLRILGERPPALERIVATGGMARNDGLCQRMADLAGLPVERPLEHEATARGTAWLVAAPPGGWGQPREVARFAPQENRGLVERFWRWEEAMASALADQEMV
jgi:glycerol kinase